MFYLLFGPDTYSSRKKLESIKQKYLPEGVGDINFVNIDGDSASFEDMMRQIQTMPFLSTKRLVIIKNLLISGQKDVQEKIAENLIKIPKETLVIFWEQGDPDKRSKLYKKLAIPKHFQVFHQLSGWQLIDWIKKEIKNRGGKIDNGAAERLATACGPDLWRLSLEIDKLLSYKDKEKIIEEDVNKMVKTQISAKIFDMIDAIAAKNARLASQKLHELLTAGENEIYLLSMIAYQFRNLIIIKDLTNRSLNPSEISQKTALHPFVIRKSLDIIDNFTTEKLQKIYQKLLEADISIKTGQIEPRLALDLLIVGLCS